jgi:hypothetical protein
VIPLKRQPQPEASKKDTKQLAKVDLMRGELSLSLARGEWRRPG